VRKGNRAQYQGLIVVAVLMGGCGGSSKSSPGSAASATAAKLAAPAQLQPPAPSPDFALSDSTGYPVRLSQFRGKALLLTFIYAITASGKRIALYPANFTSDWIVHDVPILASL